MTFLNQGVPSISMALAEASLAKGVIVVVVPFPAQGHLNQLLHLARLVSSHGIPVHYVGSGTHNRQAKDRVHGWDLTEFPNIQFHDLPLPPFSTPPPNPDASIKFPAHLQPCVDASLHLQQPFASLLGALSATARRVVVVHDSLMSFAAHEAASHPNAEAYVFNSISAFTTLFFRREREGRFEDLNRILPRSHLAPLEGCFTEEFLDFMRRQKTPPDVGRLFNTCSPIEDKFIDLLAQEPFLQNKKIFVIGPLNPLALGGARPRHECLKWLDKQPPRSVIYVSFGTTTSMPGKQIEELAAGLERSRQRFIWVLRDADRGDIFANHGDEKRLEQQQWWLDFYRKVEGMGMVVRGWAPQLEILAHPSTGGFMSHCGWNSCMESMSMGVPILAWPMHSDQPRNALLVTEALRVGVMVRGWARRDEIVPSATVEDSIRRVMASDEGKEIRTRADTLGDAVREAASEGGSSRAELDCFIAHITRS